MNPTVRNLVKILLLGIPYLNELPRPWNRLAIAVACAAVAGFAAWFGISEFAGVDVINVIRDALQSNPTTSIEG